MLPLWAGGLALVANVGGEVGLLGGGDGEGVTALIFDIACMASDPVKFNLVAIAQVQELRPEIGINGGFFAVAHPVIAPPAHGPALHDGVDDILRVGVDLDVAGFFEGLQCHDHGHDFHAVVGCVLEAAGQFFAVGSVEHNDAIAARSWVFQAGTIGIDCDVFAIGGHGLGRGVEQYRPSESHILSRFCREFRAKSSGLLFLSLKTENTRPCLWGFWVEPWVGAWGIVSLWCLSLALCPVYFWLPLQWCLNLCLSIDRLILLP